MKTLYLRLQILLVTFILFAFNPITFGNNSPYNNSNFTEDTTITEITDLQIIKSSYPLSGTYTIGTSPSNDFASFTEAIDTISALGVSGPVIFLVDSGTYYEQVSIGYIIGVSVTNTITFTSASGNKNDVLLTDTTYTNYSYILELHAAEYVTVKNITISHTAPIYFLSRKSGIYINSGAKHNSILNNTITLPTPVSTYSHETGVRIEGLYTDSNLVKGNLFYGGTYGVDLNCSSNMYEFAYGNVIDSNECSHNYTIGISSAYQYNLTISRNYIHDIVSQHAYGITSTFNYGGFAINKNTINLNSSNSNTGIYCTYCNDTTFMQDTATAYILNNAISIDAGYQTTEGISFRDADNIFCAHNSINITGLSTYSTCLFYKFDYPNSSSQAGIRIYNNIFSNNAEGYAYKILSSDYLIQMDYNCYYTIGQYIAFHGFNHQYFSLLQSYTSQPNSLFKKPNFIRFSNLHINDSILDGAASPLTYVVDDIDDDTRTATPDIGADEFDYRIVFSPVIDLGPDSTFCGNNPIVLDAGNDTTYNYTYLWTNLSNGDTLGTSQTLYIDTAMIIVVFKENEYSLMSSDTIVSSIYNSPSIYLGNDTTICIYNIICLDAGAGFTSYQWSTNYFNTTQIIFIDSNLLSGTNTSISVGIAVTDNNGCIATDTIIITFDQCTSIDEPLASYSAKLYPNPTNDYINFDINDYSILNNELRILYLLDANGKQIKEQRIESNKTRISLENLADGIYFVKIANKIYKVVKM